MTRAFIVKPLQRNSIDRAFPVAAMMAPGLSLDQWRDFCAEFLPQTDGAAHPARGILAVESGRGYVHGLCCYSVLPTLEHGPTFAIERSIAVDIVDQTGAERALMLAVNRLAQALGCRAVEAHDRRLLSQIDVKHKVPPRVVAHRV